MTADPADARAGRPPANGARRLATPRADVTRITFSFDGQAIAAFEGETIAAALAAAGVTRFRATRSGAPRAPFCGMGVCFDCIVAVDGRPGQRACLEKAADGLVVSSAPDAARLAPLAEPVAAVETRQVDVLVVGAGPAGLAAARDLAAAGASVLVVDERPQPGGQFYKPLAAPWRGPHAARDRRFRDGEALVEAARAAGAAFWPSTVAWAAFGADDVQVLRDGRTPVRIAPRALVLATGAYERIDPFPGWTLPAVTTVGGLQTLVRSYRVSPGRRIILAGNGPLVLQTAVDCLDAGLPPLAVVERAPLPWTRPLAGLQAAMAAPRLALEGLRLIARLRRAGVLMLWDSDIAEVESIDGVARVTVIRRDGALQLEADVLAVGHGFHGQSDLARQLGCRTRASERFGGALEIETDAHGETSVAEVFAIGDAVALHGAPMALAMGRIAAARIAERLGLRASGGVAAAGRARDRTARAQAALWRLFAAPDRPALDDEAMVCRCEEVTAGAVRLLLAGSADLSLALVKRHTRTGMGRCQGRYCAPAIARLVAEAGGPALGPLGLFAPRPPARPVPLAALAREQPEWGGHREEVPAPLTPQPERRRDFGEISADVAVIGAGVVGACVARELAQRGLSVVVLERDEPNLAASGANAGSLHVQLLSFDFGAKAQAGGGPAAATLRLGPPSVALWREIERASGEDLEIVTSGGLMLAETPEELAFLEAKTALERAHGVDSRVIGASELFALEPALAPHLVGAAWCPEEGKINPLVATYAVMRLAQQAGARFESRAAVQAIERAPGGWLLTTTAGRVRAGRVVNCAGGWASRVAALAGRPIPVKGAPLQMIATEPGPPLLKSLIAHGGRRLSLKQAAAGGLIIGGGWPAALDPASGASRPLLASIEGNAFVACRVLPKAASFHAIRIWAAMNVNIDGAPILGEMPGAPGFFNCVTSNGYTLAPIVARLTAQAMTGEETELDVRAFALARFG